jgi:hypothetical protein
LKILFEHPLLDAKLSDESGRTPLHMAVWGKYGGRMRRKVSLNPNDSPECC